MSFENWPVTRTRDFHAGYHFDDMTTAPAPVQNLHQAWQQINGLQNAQTLVAHTGNDTIILSNYGNIGLHGAKALNLGLVLGPLTKLALHKNPTSDRAPDFGTNQPLWNIYTRIARAHSPRALRFDIDGHEIALQSDANGFAITQGATDPGDLRDMIRAGTNISYTLDDPTDISTDHTHSALLCDSIGDWTFDQNGWPQTIPQNATQQQISDLCQIITALYNAEPLVDFRLYSATTTNILQGRLDGNVISVSLI